MSSKSPSNHNKYSAILKYVMANNNPQHLQGLASRQQQAAQQNNGSKLKKNRRKPPSQIMTTFKKDADDGLGAGHQSGVYNSYNLNPMLLSPQPQLQFQNQRDQFMLLSMDNATSNKDQKSLKDSSELQLIQQQRDRDTFSMERRAANGNYIQYACGPLRRPRYINEKIEQELIEFKKEIEEKFADSKVNREFRYPRTLDEDDDDIIRKRRALQEEQSQMMIMQQQQQLQQQQLRQLRSMNQEMKDSLMKSSGAQQQQHQYRTTNNYAASQNLNHHSTKALSPQHRKQAKESQRNLLDELQDNPQIELVGDVLNDFLQIQSKVKQNLNQRQSEIYKTVIDKPNINNYMNYQTTTNSGTHSRNKSQTYTQRKTTGNNTLDYRNKDGAIVQSDIGVSSTTNKNSKLQQSLMTKDHQDLKAYSSLNNQKGQSTSQNQKRQKSSRYNNNPSTGNHYPVLSDKAKQSFINFYPHSVLNQRSQQVSITKKSTKDPEMFKSLVESQNTVKNSVLNSRQGGNIAQFLSKDKELNNIVMVGKGNNSQKRKSSRTSKQAYEKDRLSNQNDRTQGVYKSLVVNVDDNQNPLNSAMNLVGSSRNQSELLKPQTQKVQNNQANSPIYQQLSNNPSSTQQSNRNNHQRTKTTSYMSNFLTANSTINNNNSVMKTFDYRQIMGHIGVQSPNSYISTIKSSTNQISTTQAKDNRKFQISSDLRNALKQSNPNTGKYSGGGQTGSSTTPNKYNNYSSNPQYGQLNQFKLNLNGNNNDDREMSLTKGADLSGSHTTTNNQKRLSGIYNGNQSRNLVQGGLASSQINSTNKSAGSYNISINATGMGGTQQTSTQQKKKTNNQPIQRLFSPGQEKFNNYS